MKIVYIEPREDLFVNDHNRNSSLNEFLFSRLEGIREGIKENPLIKFRWLNNGTNVKQFLQSPEVDDYDGVLLTSNDPEIYEAVELMQGDTKFLISGDTQLNSTVNYVGPDHKADVKTIIDVIIKEGIRKFDIVSCVPRPCNKEIYRYFLEYCEHANIRLEDDNFVGYDRSSGRMPFAEMPLNQRKDALVEALIKRKETEAFIFIDDTPMDATYRRLVNKYGKRIPEDVKLFSMKESGQFPVEYNEVMSRITHIKQDFKGLGLMSVRVLADIISGTRAPRKNTVLVPGKFHRGESAFSSLEVDSRSKDYFMLTVGNFIATHYKEDLSAKYISEALDLSYNYFLSKFKSSFGVKMSEYISNIRLDYATNLIAQTRKPLTKIYMEVGFANETTFVRQFKKRYAKTPSEYRRDHSGLPE